MSTTDPVHEYARGLERGGTIALSHLLDLVETHREGVIDPSTSGPTWDSLTQMLRDALARVQEGGWRNG